MTCVISQRQLLATKPQGRVCHGPLLPCIFTAPCTLRRMKRWRQCYPDEHYMPSLLAREGLDNATDCHGGIMSVDWTTMDWHPVTYTAANVSTEL